MGLGKLLREAEPELMDSLIQATKDGDHSRLQALSCSNALTFEDSDEEYEETDSDEEEEVCYIFFLFLGDWVVKTKHFILILGVLVQGSHIDIATRGLDGLINKDTEITNEVYSLHSVEFDRQVR